VAFSPNPNDHSILDALYLAVITLSTVDPSTPMGFYPDSVDS